MKSSLPPSTLSMPPTQVPPPMKISIFVVKVNKNTNRHFLSTYISLSFPLCSKSQSQIWKFILKILTKKTLMTIKKPFKKMNSAPNSESDSPPERRMQLFTRWFNSKSEFKALHIFRVNFFFISICKITSHRNFMQ